VVSVSTKKLCIELSDAEIEVLEEIAGVYNYRSAKDYIERVVRMNIENYVKLCSWVRKIIESVIDQ
jgi:hypothetical protein